MAGDASALSASLLMQQVLAPPSPGPASTTPLNEDSITRLLTTPSPGDAGVDEIRADYSAHVAAARKLAGVMTTDADAAFRYGSRLSDWLLWRGENDLAATVLGSYHRALGITNLSSPTNALQSDPHLKDAFPPPPGASPLSIKRLFEFAKAQVASGSIDPATETMALCVLELELLLKQAAGPVPQSSVLDKPTAASPGPSVAFWLTLPEILETLRDVLGYYFRQARAARDNPARATALREAANALRVKVFNDKGVVEDIVVLQVEGGTTAAGRTGLRLVGTNGREEVVTPLVGNPRMDDIKSNPYVETGMGIAAILHDQEGLIDDLVALAEVRKAVGDGVGAADLQRRTVRAKVWAAAFRGFTTSSPTWGVGKSALENVVVLMRRYLKAFTDHSWMNIRDDGPSYLDQDMPQDTLQRFIQDCGVYSVTTAYEFYLLGRAVGMGFEFRLASTVDHSMLQINAANGESYAVSNEDIVGPVPAADIEEQLAKAVGRLYGRDVVLAPSVRSRAFSSTLPDAAFRKTLWEYWGYVGQLDVNDYLQRLPISRYKGSYADLRRQYHLDLVEYNEKSLRLHAAVDGYQNVPMSALNTVDRLARLTTLVFDLAWLLTVHLKGVRVTNPAGAPVGRVYAAYAPDALVASALVELRLLITTGSGQPRDAFTRGIDLLIYVEQNTRPAERNAREQALLADFREPPEPGSPDRWKRFKDRSAEFLVNLQRTGIPTF